MIILEAYAWLALVSFFVVLGFLMAKTAGSNFFAMFFVSLVGCSIWPALLVAVCVGRRA